MVSLVWRSSFFRGPRSYALLRSLVEKLRIGMLGGGDVAKQLFEMGCHGGSGACRVVSFDRGQDNLVLRDHLRHPPPLRQGQPTVAIDVDFNLLDQCPDSGISGDFRDGAVKCLIRVMKGIPVPGNISLAL